MAIGLDLEPRPPEEEPPVEQWQTELQRVGILRRILHGRKWYGADWWFVVISSLMVIGFIILAIAPGLFAPNDPREQVGPRFLAPGEAPDQEILVIAGRSSHRRAPAGWCPRGRALF
jgi:hypothetical protein